MTLKQENIIKICSNGNLSDVNTHIWFSLCLGPKVAIFSFSSFFFGRTKWLVGSQFPNQGSNLGSLQVKLPSPNHWIAREVPKLTIFSLFLQIPYKEHWRTPGMWMQGPAVKKRHLLGGRNAGMNLNRHKPPPAWSLYSNRGRQCKYYNGTKNDFIVNFITNFVK